MQSVTPARYIGLVVLGLLLVGCSSAVRWGEEPARQPAPPRTAGTQAGYHVVRAGETLYAIAFRYGLKYQDLARWNGLGDGSLIRVGQRLRLAPPGSPPGTTAVGTTAGSAGRSGGAAGGVTPPPTASAAGPAPRWRWPVDGDVVAGFRQSPMTASGVQISGRAGAPVRAAADGQVVYSGTGLTGYGALLIVKHSDSWLSAYGHNQALLVGEGDRVRSGQEIARVGEGPGRRPLLHFEIRRNGEPVDPLTQLPAR